MNPALLSYYQAIERASEDMLAAARAGNWDEVVRLERACILLIGQLKQAAQELRACEPLADAEASAASRDVRDAKAAIMQRILMNDAEIRALADPWLATHSTGSDGHHLTLH